MSGQLNPDEPGITSTDDPAIARRRGWTDFDRETGQWSAPKTPDAGLRDGENVEAERHDAALAEGDEQHRDEHGVYPDAPASDPASGAEVLTDPLTGERSANPEIVEPQTDEQPVEGDEQPVAAEDGEPAADETKPAARKRR